MLDDLELPQVQEITTLDRRALAEHRAPGMEGTLLQNMGRRPTRLVLWGVATGPDALSLVEKLEGKFRDGKPLPFTADVVADAKIDRVLISDLRIEDLAGKPERFGYLLSLREYIEPIEPAAAADLGTAPADEARNLLEGMLPGLTGGLDFVTGLQRFVTPLSDLLSRLQKFNAAAAPRQRP